MTSQSRFYTPVTFTGDLEMKPILVTQVIAGVRQAHKLNVQRHVKLGQFKKHLSARGLIGSLYINGRCYDRADDGEELELQLSTVEIWRKAPLRFPNELSEVSVYTLPLCVKKPQKIKALKCFHTTKLDDLKFFIQDHCGIPVSLQQFKGIRSDGRVTRKMTNLRKHQAISFRMYGEGDLLLVVDYSIEKCVPDKVLDSCKTRQLISQEIGSSEWKGIARLLGLNDTEIDDIKSDNESIREQKYEALRAWHRIKGEAATWRALVCACVESKNMALAEKVVKFCKSLINLWYRTHCIVLDNVLPLQISQKKAHQKHPKPCKLHNFRQHLQQFDSP